MCHSEACHFQRGVSRTKGGDATMLDWIAVLLGALTKFFLESAWQTWG